MDNDVNAEDNKGQNPFINEFDKEEVINIKDKEIIKKEESLNLETFLSVDEDYRKQKFVKGQIATGSTFHITPEEEELQNNFKDFMQLKKISGTASGMPHIGRIPSDQLVETDKTIEITDIPGYEEMEKPSSVYLHKGENNEIEVIEITCTCGRKTFLRLDFDEQTEEPEIFEE
ncbi:MAG: hypothetical protein ABSG15_01200 [FCB group bacterium]|jgi:hypothetical protein